jgi:hypothetical protein
MHEKKTVVSRSTNVDEQGISTAASGPAGTHFEGQIAAFYLLAMLCGAPPRGLPGTAITRIGLQQANTGRPLDDVIVYAIDNSGRPAVLEIQVKRTISFSPGDEVFRKVVGQIAAALRRPDFWEIQYNLAIATSRGSRTIDGAYQDVLTLARQIGDSATFAAQLSLKGVANADMRAFVKTFQTHLKDEGAPHDDETIWKLLRRIQILIFDFVAPGSASVDLARERALRTLHADEATRADALWGNLVELALNMAKSGGDRNRITLLESLKPLDFRFSGDRRHAKARAALQENASEAIADIHNRVGQAVLTRRERVAAVYGAFDAGRYVEIRGDAGVGKSGVLRQVAESLQAEGQVLVFSPGRCVPRGWTAMKAQIAFDGTCRELLVELANDGGIVVFLDNLDSFSDEERHTAVDIIRAAADVSGVLVLATARSEFGIEEPSWLPTDALDRLGRAPPVQIDALSKAEIEQLTASDATLAPLLREGHPARQVTRNLFRLARIASQPSADPLPHTEAEMASQWWKAADGKRDAGWRDRARLFNDLALQVLDGPDVLDVSTQPAQSIDALVDSGTLRNLGPDRVSFRHDVLREWAIACALNADGGLIDRLNLKRSASATHSRAIELTARMAIERAADGGAWHTLLSAVSGDGAHKSWRRAVLLGLARSEAAEDLLLRAQPILFSNQAALLRELVRTAKAVDMMPAAKVFATAGLDPNVIPAGLTIPKGPSCFALVIWLLSIGDAVPSEAIPDVVELYTFVSLGTLGSTAITPLVTRQLYRWLRLLEPRSALPELANGLKLWENLDRGQIDSLLSDLRSGFFMFARTTPDLAAEYLRAVANCEHNDRLVQSILKLSGTLAQAAPAELASLTKQALIKKHRARHRGFGTEREDAFTFIDHQFLPTSPAQGPFFELLVHSPADGLVLIHDLVDHAIAHGTRGREAGDDVVSVVRDEGVRVFPWGRTYLWSRDSNYYAITSALMALEAWAHRRIEAGELFETVLEDVLGPPGSCAAYLLVAVDLLISHWPKSAAYVAAFLSCPELLCLDLTRQGLDQFGGEDFFGLGALQPEPRRMVSNAELKQRVSRRVSLDGLIGHYVLSADETQFNKLTELLTEAAKRLGPADATANLANPEFMVQHAMNLADRSNWQQVDTVRKDGSSEKSFQYVMPAAEENHLQALRDVAEPKSSDFTMQTALATAMEDPRRFTPAQLANAVAWARFPASETGPALDADSDETSRRMREEAVLTAAMMTMRDGDESFRTEHGMWARATLQGALKVDDDPVLQIRAGLRYNPSAIAFTGVIYAFTHQETPTNARALLEVAAVDHHSAAHGFGAAVRALYLVNEKLPRAILRCALRGCIVATRKWEMSMEEQEARAANKKATAMAGVDAEMAWLEGTATEPRWPEFPRKNVRQKYRLRVPAPLMSPRQIREPGGLPPAYEIYHQTAALWLRQVQGLGNADRCPWQRDVVNAYMSWTIEANGGDSSSTEEVDDTPTEWNDVFFELTARCVVGLTQDEVADLVTTRIAALPDENFFDVLADFLPSFDGVYFEGGSIDTSVAVAVRAAFGDRMTTSRGWARLRGTVDSSIEFHIAPAIATLFFNFYQIGGTAYSYLYEKGIERLRPFLPGIGHLVQSAPSPYVALVLLNLLAVAPRAEHLDLLVQAGKTWLAVYPENRSFWIDLAFGKRWCEIVERIHVQDPAATGISAVVRADIEHIVADLVGVGVSEATRLEDSLYGRS